jgi:hypothetical protein
MFVNKSLLFFSLDIVVGDEFEAASAMESLSLLHKLCLHKSLVGNIIPQSLSYKVLH